MSFENKVINALQEKNNELRSSIATCEFLVSRCAAKNKSDEELDIIHSIASYTNHHDDFIKIALQEINNPNNEETSNLEMLRGELEASMHITYDEVQAMLTTAKQKLDIREKQEALCIQAQNSITECQANINKNNHNIAQNDQFIESFTGQVTRCKTDHNDEYELEQCILNAAQQSSLLLGITQEQLLAGTAELPPVD